MLVFFLSVCFGILQMILLSRLLRYATSGGLGKTALFCFMKLALYVVGIGLLLFQFEDRVIYAACGYTAGLPLGAIVYVLVKTMGGKGRRWWKRKR